MFSEPVLLSPKKAGVISPPPGKIKASQPESSPKLKVVSGVARMPATKAS